MTAKNKRAHELVMDARRRQVASLRLRGFSLREIVQGLPELRIINVETQQPWTLTTIHADIVALEAQWKAAAVSDINQHKGNLNAELEEVKRVSWQAKDTTGVLAAIKQQRDLLGTDAPKRTEIGGIPDGQPIRTQSDSILEGIDLGSLTKEQLDTLETAVNTLDSLRVSGEKAGGA
jgi:hypothetical protein